jgi:adenosylhomocysteine nucleosidase
MKAPSASDSAPGAPSARILFPGRWLVCFAVKEEAKAFHPADPGIGALVTGMGRANAETSLRAAIASRRPDLVLTCGFAGGLDPSLARGTVLFSADAPPSLDSLLRAAGATSGKFHCSDHVASTAAEKRALRQSTRSDAVEMESYYIRALCREQGIPSATLRVILDTAAEDLPLDFNRLMTSGRRMSLIKLAVVVMGSPGKIKALLRLQREAGKAAHALAEVLARLMISW